MFVDIALKAIVVQLIYAAVIILVDKIGSKRKKDSRGADGLYE